MESVVTRKTYHRAEGDPYRSEDLRRSVDPYLININNIISNFKIIIMKRTGKQTQDVCTNNLYIYTDKYKLQSSIRSLSVF